MTKGPFLSLWFRCYNPRAPKAMISYLPDVNGHPLSAWLMGVCSHGYLYAANGSLLLIAPRNRIMFTAR